MTDTVSMQRDERGDWRPAEAIVPAPINNWPPNPIAIGKWLLAWPGFLWPYHAIWLVVAIVTWTYLTPDLATMQSIDAWWVGVILARNVAITLFVFGGLHLYLHVLKGQGDEFQYTSRPFAVGNRRFRFSHQVRDNMFYSVVCAVPVFTAYEVVSYWGFANGILGYGVTDAGTGFWVWTGLLLLAGPFIHSVHFYFAHRLLHSKLLYRRFHSLHHRNVDIGPWSGLAMHPVEHALYFSTVVVQWLFALHPVNALFQIQLAVFNAAFAHTGFERVKFGKALVLEGGSHFHYLHHKHFECNYGGSLIPLDRLFGTFHDGTIEADATLRERLERRRQLLRAATVR